MKKLSRLFFCAAICASACMFFTFFTAPVLAAEKAQTTFGLKPYAEKQTLRVGFFAGSPLSIPFFIADKEGFFKELNIEIVYETFTNGPAMMEANSTWDIAGCGEGGALTGIVGYGVKIIGISDYEENLALFARPGSALAKDPKNPANWKGSTWLYPVGTTAQASLVAALNRLNLKNSDVKSINMDVASALTGFMGGAGDGLVVWNAIAFAAEDRGFVRIDDAGTLGFVAPCVTLATDKALAEKKDLLTTAYLLFYLTWEWCNKSPENMAKAVNYYLVSCEDEGIACDLSIAKRVMQWYKAPFLQKSFEIMTETAPDVAGLYTKRPLLKAERDVLVGMDFFISQNKYTPADRNRILDAGSVDPVIALEAQKRALAAGLIKK